MNDFLMQFQADLIAVPVLRPDCVETTALGAAYLAGLAVGYWPDRETIAANHAIERTFTPAMEEEKRKREIRNWNKAVDCARGWAAE